MEAVVTTANGTSIVSIDAYDKMTPRAAIAFRNVAGDIFASATVAGGGKTYRVTGGMYFARARLVPQEDRS